VMTVASGSTNVIKLKGIDTFARAAAHIPGARFLVLGLSDQDKEILRAKYPSSNLELCGYASAETLIECYQKTKVYCQLSYRESFGVALAEAMACECIPVATNSSALPEVVGDTGFFVSYGSLEETARTIIRALEMPVEFKKKARARVESHFSSRDRERELVKTIDQFVTR